MEPRRVRVSNLDPGSQRAGQIADGDGRLVGIRQAAGGKRDAFGELERVGEQPGDEILRGLGRMSRDAKVERP